MDDPLKQTAQDLAALTAAVERSDYLCELDVRLKVLIERLHTGVQQINRRIDVEQYPRAAGEGRDLAGVARSELDDIRRQLWEYAHSKTEE